MILDVAIQIVEALKEAHSHGVIHCDIKSSNIMITDNGVVKVLDFGLAKIQNNSTSNFSSNHPEERLTTTDFPGYRISGTLSYMSPEQVRGESVDTRSDLFSFGIVMYEMVTGCRPFVGETLGELIHSILSEVPPSTGTLRADVPLQLESIIRKCLHKKQDERYQSANQLLDDLIHLKAILKQETGFLVTEEMRSERKQGVHYNLRSELLAFRSTWLFPHRKLLLYGGVLAALALSLYILEAQPRGMAWIWSLGLLLISVVGFVGYYTARREYLSRILSPPKGAAFRGLLSFQEADCACFYGRETEVQSLFDMMTHGDSRFGLLFGDSGCGKTSLLRAGLVPRLWQAGYLPVYCRSYRDPLRTIVEECRKHTQIQCEGDEPAIEYLRRVVRDFGAEIIIICDQFEEFFVHFKTRRARAPFISFVTQCYHTHGLPVKFLFSLRSNFLYLLNLEFADGISEPLLSSRLFHLRSFNKEQAEEIIAKAARSANLPFETGLIRKVTSDLVINDLVLPSELQIVGEQLQNQHIYTLAKYLRSGGKESLMHNYLQNIIEASGEREAVQLLLRSLISEEDTHLTLSLTEITKRIQRDKQTVQRLLDLLVKCRLVREIQDEEPWRYELMHEYLIAKINQITGKVMDATQRANRLFRKYVANYTVDSSTRIPLMKLWFIRRYSDLQQGSRERELLRKSIRWGVLKGGVLLLLLVATVTIVSALLSLDEAWQGTRLRDGHTAALRRAVFSPDGRLLVSGGDDAKVMVWNFARRMRLAMLTDHNDWVNSIAFSPDGRWLVSGSNDSSAMLWDAQTFKKIAELRGHHGKVKIVAFSPDGTRLATGGDDGWAILWEAGSWNMLKKIPFSSNNWYFLFIDHGRRLMHQNGQVWKVETGQQLTDVLETGLIGNASALSPDESLLVTVTGTGNVVFLNPTGRKLLWRSRAHRDHGSAVAFSPNGRLIATGAEDIVLWQAATFTKLTRFEHSANVRGLAFSPDERWLVSAHEDGAILVWDVQERVRVADFSEHTSAVRAVDFSSDGQRVASAGADRSVIIWNTDSGRKEAVLMGHDNIVKGVAFSPDGRWVASTDQDATVILWNLEKRQPLWISKYPGHAHSYDLDVSPDGNWVATTCGVYATLGGTQVVDFTPQGDLLGTIFGVAFSSDGRWLASAATEGKIFLWDVATWQWVDSLDAGEMHLKCIDFSPDGKFLVTGESQGVVRLWRVNPLRQVAVLGRHSARVRSVAFSPEGDEVASASDDQTIALWDVKRRKLITHIGSHTAPVNAVRFSPDGKRLACGGHDKSVYIFTRHQILWGKQLD